MVTGVSSLGLVALALLGPGKQQRIAVPTTQKVVARSTTISYELDEETRLSLAEAGAPMSPAPIGGRAVRDTHKSTIHMNEIDLNSGEIVRNMLLETESTNIEPVGALLSSNGSLVVVATSSGRYELDTNLADELLAFDVPSDSLDVVEGKALYENLGHSVNRVTMQGALGESAILTISTENGVRSSTLTPEVMKVGVDREFDEVSDRIRHDRLGIAGSRDHVLTIIDNELLLYEAVRPLVPTEASK